MEILVIDPYESWVYIMYRKTSNGDRFYYPQPGGPLIDVWPELYESYFALAKSNLGQNSMSVFTSMHTRNVEPDFKPPVSYEVIWPTQRVATPHFTKAVKAHEVIVNPYAVGKVTVMPSFSFPPYDSQLADTPSAFSAGWYTDMRKLQAACPYATLPPRPPIGDAAVCEASALFVFKWVTISADSMLYSPPVSVGAEVPDFKIDTAIVTSAAADCANGTVDLLTELVELPETMAFLGETVKKICFMTCDLEVESRRMRKVLPPERFVRWFSDHWLKGRYALLPLFYLVSDISDVLKSMGIEFQSYRRSASVSTPIPADLYVGTECDERDVRHRCSIKSKYDPDSLMADFRRLINFNVASTLYEVTTFSFVADWVFNIGDYIAALTGSDGAVDQHTTYSVRCDAEYEVRYDSADPQLQGLTTSVKYDCYRRYVINTSDHLGLTFDPYMNWKRCTDAFALASKPGIARLKSLLKRA